MKLIILQLLVSLTIVSHAQNACNDGLTPMTAFTSLSEARSISTEGIYYFNINNQSFSTPVNLAGYVQLAIDFGNGNGDLPQVNTLDNTDRGILTPSILAGLTNIERARISHSGGQLDVTTSNTTIINRITSNIALHKGSADNGINNDWTGINSNVITSNATCNSSLGTLLSQTIAHLCGNLNGFHWLPAEGIQRITHNLGEIADTESLSLWVQANETCCENSIDCDNDGVCDLEDICPNIDDNLIGLPCNDGNACTTNDVWNSNCDCKGEKLPDSDNDGICDALDQCPNFDDNLDIDKDDIPYCLDNCVDVDEDGICDNVDGNVVVDKLKIYFSHERGFYNNSFNLQILSNDPNVVIKYTTTADLPSTSNGNTYNNPININGQTVLKIIAYNGSETTELVTNSYIFLQDVISNDITNTDITNNANWSNQLETALLDLPTISISGAENFISNDEATARLETAISFEYIDPKDCEDFQINAGINAYGFSSILYLPKKNYRIKFDSNYGDKNLKFPLFKGFEEGLEPVEKFDKLDLRSSHDSWLYNSFGTRNFYSTKMLDDLMKADGNINPHCRHVHVYMNGKYWGMYTLKERFDDNMVAEYEDKNNDDYDFISGSKSTISYFDTPGEVIDGSGNFWQSLVSSSNNYTNWKAMVNESNFFDLMIFYMVFYHEAEWNAVGTMSSENGFLFNINDADFMFTEWWGYTDPNPDGHRVSTYHSNGPNDMFKNLYDSGSNSFRRDFADRVQCHFQEDGILTKNYLDTKIDELAEQIELAIIAESGRWGENGENPTAWENEIERTKNVFTSTQPANVFGYIKDFGLFPSLNQVVFSNDGGFIDVAENIVLSNPNATGNLYYTLNGEDVRTENGTLNANAILYTTPITLSAGVSQIYARVYDPAQSNSIDKWSAFCCPKTFYIAQNYSDLVINEIHYNPNDSIYFNSEINAMDTLDGRNFEFVELTNKGTEAVHLYGTKFSKGIQLEVEDFIVLQPDSFVVFAEDPYWFEARYGFPPDGRYSGQLDNNGEKINLKNPKGYFIDTLRYNDVNPWDEAPDANDEYTLELLHPTLDNTDPLNWFRSDNYYGTPRAENSRICNQPTEQIIINEINYNSDNDNFDPGDWVELHNPSAAAVDLSGWTFYDNNNDFIFPAGTSIGAGAFLVLVENEAVFSGLFPHLDATQYLGDFTFGLSNKGERVSLFNENKCLSDYVIYNDRIPWDTIPDGNGPSLSLITPNSDNADALAWESSSNINAAYGTPGRANEPCLVQQIIAPDTLCLGYSTMLTLDILDENTTYNWFISGSSTPIATTDSVNTSWANAGTYNIQLVSNYFECTKIYTQQIVVQSCNTAPNLGNDFYSVAEDNVLNNGQNLLANDNPDPEGDNLFVSPIAILPPNNGTVSLNPDGTFIYTPKPNFNGNDSFEYEVCDDGNPIACNTAVVDIIVNPVNDIPIALDDNAITQEDNSHTSNLLSNDSEPDGENLILNPVALTPPTNGNVFILANGFYAYTPNPDFNGTDSFTYEICDSGSPALCDIGTVYITVNPVNDAPVAVADTATISMDEMLAINVLINDTDIDGDLLVANVNVVSPPANGSVAIQANGNVSYQPNVGYVGTDSFDYEACDLGGLCSTATVTIEINPGCVDFDIYAFLEGPYDTALGEMETELNILRGLLPGQTPASNFANPTPAGQPYNGSPWNYTGTEGAAWTDANYTDDIVDWVLVSARTDIAKSSEVGRAAGLLYKDGSINFPESCALENLELDSVYVVVEHRNHIGIMTPQKVPIINNGLTYDFRLSDSYKDATSFGQKQSSTGDWLMFAGDGDQSDFPSFDITGTDKALWLDDNGVFQQYLIPDFDLNGDVNGADKALWNLNNGVSSRVPK